jgi:chromate transporter
MATHPIGALTPTRARSLPTKLEFARFSLWAGVAGFGGGLSVLAMLRSVSVERKGWLTPREFDNTATVAQMLPGGAAANALALLGLRFFGTEGAVGAYATFIFPGFVAVLALAGFYAQVSVLPRVGSFLGGLNAAVVGIVIAITLQMVRSSVGRIWQMGVAGVALALSLAGGSSPGEVAILGVGAGLVLDLAYKRARLVRSRKAGRPISPPVGLPNEGEPLRKRDSAEHAERTGTELRAEGLAPIAAAFAAVGGTGTLIPLALLFFRTGIGAYGGGFAIVPHLQGTLVTTGLLSQHQFADAVAIGKITPGPVLLLATFIGYLKAGVPGAVVSTVAIFLGPLMLTIVLGRWLARYRSRRAVRAALRGLTPAVVGTMAAAAVSLGSGLRGSGEIAIAGVVAMTLARFQVSPVVMIFVGGLAGLGLSFVRL